MTRGAQSGLSVNMSDKLGHGLLGLIVTHFLIRKVFLGLGFRYFALGSINPSLCDGDIDNLSSNIFVEPYEYLLFQEQNILQSIVYFR